MKELKKLITERVNKLAPIKAMELIVDLISSGLDHPDLPSLLEEMVKEKLIAEIEYCPPDMDYRLKSIYFSAGTLITVKN